MKLILEQLDGGDFIVPSNLLKAGEDEAKLDH